MRILVKFIRSKFKNLKGNKIRSNQNISHVFTFDDDIFLNQQQAHSYFKNKYYNVGKVIIL